MNLWDGAQSLNSPMLQAIAWLYVGSNLARVASYVPQMIAIWRCTNGAKAISLLTWSYWALSHATAVLYGALLMHDARFTLVSAVNLVCCALVVALTLRRRGLHLRRGVPFGAPAAAAQAGS